MQTATPFFTNDIVGLLKLLGTFGSMILVVTGVVVKWGQSSFAKRLDVQEHDLNEVGKRINQLSAECTESNARRDELRARFDRREPVMDQIIKDLGHLESTATGLEKADRGLQIDMMTMIQSSLKDRDEKIDTMGRELARLQARLEERENSRQIIREILDMKRT